MAIKVFTKNQIDLDVANVTITATDGVGDPGQDFVEYLRNRKNDSGWGTAGSTDAGNTKLIIDTTDSIEVSDVFLVGMNFKGYTFKYWNGAAYTDFSTPINVSNNTTATKYHSFTAVNANLFELVITGTMTADEDKFLAQLILTTIMGTFTTEPFVKKPTIGKDRKVRKMLSGRASITKTVGAFACSLSFPTLKDTADWALIEEMFDAYNGFLLWLCGGDTTNFFTNVQGWRLQDIYLVNAINDLETEWTKGHFAHGQSAEIKLVESRL